jgi:exonuclease III
MSKHASVGDSKYSYRHTPDNPRATAGVAFVINKALINPRDYKLHVIQPGHAVALKINWLEDEEMLLFNVYAPNAREEHASFWERIDLKRRELNLRRPDFMMGDFNLTEDRIDRAPAHDDDMNATNALRSLRHTLNLQDSWRHTFPNERCFTYRANANGGQIQSRLDRIYTSNTISNHILEWKTQLSPVPTDHSLVMAKYTPKNSESPHVGKGRWTWRPHAMSNIRLLAQVEETGIQLRTDLEKLQTLNVPREIENPQTLWKKFKDDVKTLAKTSTGKTHHKITTKIKKLSEDLRSLANHPDMDNADDARVNEALMASELAHLEKIMARDQKDFVKATLANHGERLGGPWSAISKEHKPRDLIRQLKVPGSNPPQFERCSRRMANLARDYHEKLQHEGLGVPHNHPNYNHKLKTYLNEIPLNQRLSEEENQAFKWRVEPDQVRMALSLAKNGSATGMDGLPYELWKELNDMNESAHKQERDGFDIADTLSIIFQDIQDHGIDKRSDFALGWMCPILKKNDKREISNYRPITLLNTDYKLLTKVLAIQLMKYIPDMVHPNQAGFIPSRSIFDHIRLAKSIISYAEVMDVDGAIVALDQEKAYDKIRHEYLWETMKEYNLPDPFTNTVKALYRHAFTRVAINGEFSPPFQVTRGVRQGDPLSCALFDLAIEPLACKLRNDQTISGIAIPGLDEKILVNMFADDTTLYLNKNDSFDYIENLLKQWCEISGAKFNIGKTEIIPIGTTEHRATIVTSRKINLGDQTQLSTLIKIAKDGDATRLLGAWIGNEVNDLTPWERIIDLIKKDLDRWNKIHPTLYGKCIIIQAIIGGRTQYLAKLQGMPRRTEAAIQKMIQDFIWDGERAPRIALETLELPLEKGGLNLLNMRTRNEAIDIMWLKSYLNFSPSRPTWAVVTDLLLNASAPPNVSPLGRLNTYMQSWNPPTKGPRSAYLNQDIARMINTAKRYKTNLAALRIAPEISNRLPAWYHVNAKPRPLTNIPSKCLLKNHNIMTVADLIKASARAHAGDNDPHITQPIMHLRGLC